MKIKYSDERKCPFYENIIVGSELCLKCGFFLSKNEDLKIVRCRKTVAEYVARLK